jgi:formate dehydrogenase iron-sulfur subunit
MKGKKALLIDGSLCIACRACQVACKLWHDLPPEDAMYDGIYEVPQDLTGTRWTLVKIPETEDDRVRLLFFKDQCRHCQRPQCQMVCPVSGAIERDSKTGAVVITDACDPDACGTQPCERACPYNVPCLDEEVGRERKCDFCYDRTTDNSDRCTSCADACPTGAIQFGDLDDISDLANQRLAEIIAEYPRANIYPNRRTGVMWLLTAYPSEYGLKPNA